MNPAVRRAGWATACVLLAALLLSYFQQPVTWAAAGGVLAYAGLTAWRPYAGLLVLAGLGPLATIILSQGRGDAGTIAYAEVALLGFLTGWTARQTVTTEPLRVTLTVRAAALLLAVAAAASAVVHAARARIELQHEPVGEFTRVFLRDYILHPPGAETLTAAAPFAAGLLLLLAAAHLTAGTPERRTAVLRMMVCGAAAAAALNIVRIGEIVLRQDEGVATAFLELFATYRSNVQYADRNAAGSYFAMLLMLAAAVATRARVLGVVTIAFTAAGLWISGSRLALAAAGMTAAAALVVSAWRAESRQMRTAAFIGVLALATVMGTLWIWYPAGRNIRGGAALEIRLDLARAGLEMMRDHPVFGVGPGRYYVLSSEYAGEALQALNFTRENAHNNFVQIGAELGLAGLAAFIVLLVAAFRELRPRASAEHRWLAAGVAAYLLTCLGGHPLLVPDAAVPFWLTLGLVAAPASEPERTLSRWRFLPAVLAGLLVASVWPRAAVAVRTADLEHVSAGLSKWQHEPDGSRYRWAGGRSTFYVPATASAVRIPLRNGAADRRTIEVAIVMDGREADRILLPANDRWREARVLLRPSGKAAFTRVDLVVFAPGGASSLAAVASDTGGLVHVGRAIIEP